MAGYQRGQCLLHLIGILWFTHVLIITAEYTSYGGPHSTYHTPWFTHSKHVYPTHAPYLVKSQWYPIAGPYTYGPELQNHYATPFPHHHISDYPSGVSQQQIVHIHDVGPPEIPSGDSYQEGDDYKIHNLISHVDTLHQDLMGEASSKVETRKHKPSTTTTNQQSNFNKRRVQNKPRRNQNDNKRRPSQASSLRHPQPAGGQSRAGGKNAFRKSSKLRQPIQRQQQQFRRSGPSRRKTRPTRRTHSRRPYYDEDYDNYGRRRGSGGNYRGNSYKNSNQEFARQGDDYYDYYDDYYYYYYDYDNYDETTSVEPTSTEESSTATTVSTTATTTTETPESTLSTIEGSTTIGTNASHGFHEYGPSNGNENISITYAPIVHDGPFANLWYSQQGIPDIFQYKNYFSSRDLLN